jgi:hypothetical protein
MNVTLSPEERDRLYEQILVHLSGIGDVWLAIEQEDFVAADRLGREFGEELQVVLDGLGWGDLAGREVRLTSSPEVLLRVFARLRDRAQDQRQSEEEERAEAERAAQGNHLVIETCERIIASLKGSGTP